MSTETGSEVITLPMDVEYQPAWLTWVAATTTCLKALGVGCDQVDVAGFSGYAFHVGVHEEVRAMTFLAGIIRIKAQKPPRTDPG